MLTLTREQAAVVTGVPSGTLGQLQKSGLIPRSGRLTLVQCLALAVGKGLKANGFPIGQAVKATYWLWLMSRERLEADLSRGACFLVLVGGRLAIPRLLARKDVEGNAQVEAIIAFDKSLAPTLVDVGRVWRRILEQVAQMERTDASRV